MLSNQNRILSENISNVEGSFIYTLHELNLFDINGFYEFVDALARLNFVISEEKRIKVIRIFFYVLKSIIYHYDERDSSEIVNFKDITDTVACIVEISEYVVGCFSSNTRISLDVVKNIKEEYM